MKIFLEQLRQYLARVSPALVQLAWPGIASFNLPSNVDQVRLALLPVLSHAPRMACVQLSVEGNAHRVLVVAKMRQDLASGLEYLPTEN